MRTEVIGPEAAIQALRGRVNAALGYPIQNTDSLGEPIAGSFTREYAEPMPYAPDSFAYPFDEHTRTVLETWQAQIREKPDGERTELEKAIEALTPQEVE